VIGFIIVPISVQTGVLQPAAPGTSAVADAAGH
ncbi:MAG: hypothetical protein JWN48_4415, partial [Myxococcaceae bacterium]|nr:hypothetical protein [Myxococcaceae bacterium]